MKNYITVIGLEVHAELKTKTKAFCSCSTEFGAEPNTHVCPVCLGMPGALPVLNKRVVEFAIRAGLALNCDIQKFNKMDRKNYFYPDLAKNYQISQWDEPICLGGHIDIRVNGEKKRIGITRIHMEEDAGKLVHSGLTISTSDSSAVDYNRAGVPLIEIVSEPDMRSAAEARAYMEQLKAILEYTDVCDCKMQEGSLRCDANISVMPEGATEFGTRAEIKNLNSFRALERAIEYEVERQIEIVEDGGHVVQETRTWDDANGVTLSMRSKEEAHDYRYFPEPDLVPINLDQAWIDEIKATLPELPSARKERLLAEDVPEDNADIIVASKKVADYFDEGTKATKNLKALSNWLIGDVAGYLNAEGIEIDDPEFKITPDHLGELVNLIDKGVLSSKLAKQVFAEMLKDNEAPEALVKKLGLEQVSDVGELGKLVDEVIAANPQSIADFKAGKKKALGFLVGQIMKATHGKANPGMVNKMLMEKLQ
ncbi:Asp-tRNA(Asn)/Glu-tRNA(Gln) amidotransferase subunit GatB [uncultured Succiniclasticum sp.]|uniref:Asp-tRNA(Asn)/Glu-tRNA(Gln) amidotransferase subunit GatB n=1 Tax=uncultured Succiniclasticum sp. TaxID=1500547 RepID=UPI0025E1BD3A|nr:Asp-tRNA(Asn)/Glu-tRNA(Gln) amidotransferase subunit GatB [uncultured Succiniclasticum sp.]